MGQNGSMRKVVLLLVGALALTGCTAPSQKYPGSKSEGVFFTVPYSWREISPKALEKYQKDTGNTGVMDRLSMVRYEIAYTTDPNIGPHEVFSLSATDKPVAFLRVRTLFPDEVNNISYNVLRNILIPVSQIVTDPKASDPPLDLVDDYEVADKGARGVRTIYRVTLEGKEQVIDQTAMTSPDRSILYVFVIRCSTQCYNKNKTLMTKISDSFSVKGPR